MGRHRAPEPPPTYTARRVGHGALAATMVGGATVPLLPVSVEVPTESVSVADQLDIEEPSMGEITRELELMAVSRSTREAEQAEAVQVQQEADQRAREAAEAAAAELEAQRAAEEAARLEAEAQEAVQPVVGGVLVPGATLTSTYGMRWGTLHAGIDLAAPIGTPIHAAMGGTVQRAGPATGFGLAVYVLQDDGSVAVYGHINEFFVAAGQRIEAGEHIADVGNRGDSTGPHLHFEVRVGQQPYDPIPWLNSEGIAY